MTVDAKDHFKEDLGRQGGDELLVHGDAGGGHADDLKFEVGHLSSPSV